MNVRSHKDKLVFNKEVTLEDFFYPSLIMAFEERQVVKTQ